MAVFENSVLLETLEIFPSLDLSTEPGQMAKLISRICSNELLHLLEPSFN
jgi:hypothetical protein